ncbi:MAG: AAA family ATPase [Pseudoleptotrichia goodfellowii]|nr:AAA family ATPase [Pseudoleptotrichia goodfellowii]
MTDSRKSIEHDIIAKLLISPIEIRDVIETGLQEKHFSDEDFKKIYGKMIELYEKNGEFEIFDLPFEIEELMEITDEGYAVISIYRAACKLIEISQKTELENRISKVLLKSGNLEDQRSEIIKIIEDVKIESKAENQDYGMEDLLDEWYKGLDNKKDKIDFPYTWINDFFHLEKGSLYTIGARPGLGKTAFALNLAYLTGQKDYALYVNLEMSRRQVINRLLAIDSGVPLNRITNGTLDDDEIMIVNDSASKLHKLKFRILDCEEMDFHKIIYKMKKMHEKQEFGVIIIDYLTLMSAKGHQSKNYEVEYMANRLKLLAKELDTCIVVLAQLNRALETRSAKDKRPMLSDLRDSGGIEQASNVVAFLHREDYFQNGQSTDVSDLEFIIQKNRGGALGTVHLSYKKTTQKIKEKNNIGR